MGLFDRRRVRRRGPGRYELRLPATERTVLADLVAQLRELLVATTDDPLVRRLFPTAYHVDADRDREYQQLVRDELLERRLAALSTVEETLELDSLDEAQLTGWMTAINDVRLVLGTRLDVSEEPVEIDLDDPEAPPYAVYEYLGFLLSQVVDALEGDLPEPDEDAG
ncbi:MAG TPA: DUF2017 family protein [Acidimicrobiales bacterium]|nr:DUF2017 family protein [Acidimicrobiales bacterium]